MTQVSETAYPTRTAAAVLICDSYIKGAKPDQFKSFLRSYGVLKGTISKMVAILEALRAHEITLEDVTSVNHAYELIQRSSDKWLTKLSDQELQKLLSRIGGEFFRRQQDQPGN